MNWTHPTQNCATILQSKPGNGYRNIYIYIYIYIYITGAQVIDHKNINADRESRKSSYDLKWMLCRKSLKSCPEIHPRDRHVCKQCKFHIYFLHKADPKAKTMDSFTVIWHSLKVYVFQIFSEISRKLKKIKGDKSKVY